MPMSAKTLESRFALAKVLVVDDEPGMRKVVRALLMSIGVQNIYEAAGASRGLELVRSKAPHVVILDWEMPGLDGACFMRFLRSAGSAAHSDVPVIMLSGHSERSRVMEAMKLGVNEFLLKPVSSAALRERLIAVLVNPRPMVCQGDYYGPLPRKNPPAVQEDPQHNPHLILL